MIPKIIHYCWFGGNPLPELAQKCIESWKKYCPDYEIIEWNESNFDVNCCRYAKEAYEAKKWAFVSDVARLFALVNQGGIYMDTDVELLKPLDDFLELEAVSGFESTKNIPTGLMACRKDFLLFKEFLEWYDDKSFVMPDGRYNMTTNVTIMTDICLEHGLEPNNKKQTVSGFTLFPSEYFCPKDYETKKLNITNNTYAIHHFDGSWHTDEIKYMIKLNRKLKKLMPEKYSFLVAKFFSVIKYQGVKSAFFELKKFFGKK